MPVKIVHLLVIRATKHTQPAETSNCYLFHLLHVEWGSLKLITIRQTSDSTGKCTCPVEVLRLETALERIEALQNRDRHTNSFAWIKHNNFPLIFFSATMHIQKRFGSVRNKYTICINGNRSNKSNRFLQ